MWDDGSDPSWHDAVNIFEEQRPDLRVAVASKLTASGVCRECGAEGTLVRMATSTEPDTCPACRGGVR
jgi:hypothetical protein